MKIDPNAPAFPNDRKYSDGSIDGMTIRVELAKTLMAAAMARPGIKGSFADFAEGACKAADALIAELNRTTQP